MVFDIIPWCNTSPAIYAIIFFIMAVVVVFFNLMFSTYALYKMYKATRKSPMHMGIKILYIVINILFGTFGIGYIVQISVGFDCGPYTTWTTSGLIAHNSYFYGLTFLYLLYLIRLWMIFHSDIIDKYSTVVLISGGIGFILQCSMHPIATYFFELDPPENYPLATMCMNIFAFLNLVFSLFLLCLFWIKVKSLGRMYDQNSNIILEPAIIYAFCAFVSVLSSQIVNAISFYRAYIDRDEHYFFLSLQYVLVMADAFINLICLFFQFDFGRKYYLKYFGKMHLYVKSKVLRKMSNINKKTTATNKNTTTSETKTTNSVISTCTEIDITATEPQTEKKDTSTDIISSS